MTSNPDGDRLARYARLAVGAGMNLRQGQPVPRQPELAHAPRGRAIGEGADAHGAAYVDVRYADPWVHRAHVAGAPEETVGITPGWQLNRLESAIDGKGATVLIVGAAHADVYEGLDATRLADARMPELR